MAPSVLKQKAMLKKFFDIAGQVFKRNKLHVRSDRIFAVTEVRLSLTFRGSFFPKTTILLCCSADGTVLPPFVVFRGQLKKLTASKEVYPDAYFVCNSHGGIDEDIFHWWFRDHFLKKMPPGGTHHSSALFLSRPASDITIQLLQLAKEERCSLVSMPTGVNHLLQPLDMELCQTVKNGFARRVQKWESETSGQTPFTQRVFAQLLQHVWQKCIAAEEVTRKFSQNGLFPLNHNAITPERIVMLAAQAAKEDEDESQWDGEGGDGAMSHAQQQSHQLSGGRGDGSGGRRSLAIASSSHYEERRRGNIGGGGEEEEEEGDGPLSGLNLLSSVIPSRDFVSTDGASGMSGTESGTISMRFGKTRRLGKRRAPIDDEEVEEEGEEEQEGENGDDEDWEDRSLSAKTTPSHLGGQHGSMTTRSAKSRNSSGGVDGESTSVGDSRSEPTVEELLAHRRLQQRQSEQRERARATLDKRSNLLTDRLSASNVREEIAAARGNVEQIGRAVESITGGGGAANGAGGEPNSDQVVAETVEISSAGVQISTPLRDSFSQGIDIHKQPMVRPMVRDDPTPSPSASGNFKVIKVKVEKGTDLQQLAKDLSKKLREEKERRVSSSSATSVAAGVAFVPPPALARGGGPSSRVGPSILGSRAQGQNQQLERSFLGQQLRQQQNSHPYKTRFHDGEDRSSRYVLENPIGPENEEENLVQEEMVLEDNNVILEDQNVVVYEDPGQHQMQARGAAVEEGGQPAEMTLSEEDLQRICGTQNVEEFKPGQRIRLADGREYTVHLVESQDGGTG